MPITSQLPLPSLSTMMILGVILLSCLCIGCGVAVTNAARVKKVTPTDCPDGFNIMRYQKEVDRYSKKKWFARHDRDCALFLGSSSITLWKSLAHDLAPHPVINRGFGGSTLIEQNYYLDQLATTLKPAQLFLYAGENDLSLGRTVEETHQELITFIEQCEQKLPNTKIIYLAMKPSPAKWYLWDDMQRARSLALQYCQGKENVTYLDPSQGLLNSKGMPDEKFYLSDKLHLSAKGYKVWTDNIKPFLDALRSPHPQLSSID